MTDYNKLFPIIGNLEKQLSDKHNWLCCACLKLLIIYAGSII